MAAAAAALTVMTPLIREAAKGVHPFEFARLPFAAIVGFVVSRELPDIWARLGGAVIFSASLYRVARNPRAAVKCGRDPGPAVATPIAHDLTSFDHYFWSNYSQRPSGSKNSVLLGGKLWMAVKAFFGRAFEV